MTINSLDFTQIPNLEKLTLMAEKYDWSALTSDNYRHATNWFLQTCDPRCVLVERSSSSALGLRYILHNFYNLVNKTIFLTLMQSDQCNTVQIIIQTGHL